MPRHNLMIVDPGASQAPFLEYDPRTGRWRVWVIFNDDATAGTYIDLYPTGQSERLTTFPNGDVFKITRLTGPVANGS